MGSAREARSVRLLFLLAATILPVQHIVQKEEGEPYPGLFMPSFGRVPQSGHTATSTQPTLLVSYRDGQQREFTAGELLPENPVLPALTLRAALDRTAAARDPRTLRWLRQLVIAAGDTASEPARAQYRQVTTRYDLRSGRRSRIGATPVRTLRLDAP